LRIQLGPPAVATRLGRRLHLLPEPQAEPSERLFHSIRWRLTLIYSMILAAALIVSGAVLYLGVQQSLLGPVDQQLRTEASTLAQAWQGSVDFPSGAVCPVSPHFVPSGWLVACYDSRGHLLTANDTASGLRRFLSSSQAKLAVSAGQVTNTVTTNGPGDFSAVQRYAMRVPVPGSRATLGVIQVGFPVGSDVSSLTTLLHLLLILGALTTLFSLGVGLFLANRALLPARVAYSRQRDFIADASHELRTPLTMMRSSLEFVLRGRDHLPPQDVALLDDAVLETGHLTALANSMLSLARLDADALRLEEEVVDLAEIARESTRWGQSLAERQGVTVELCVEEPVLVLGDRALLQQVVLILIDNAVKYNRHGGRVTVSTDRAEADALLEVSDTGIGIAREHLDRLGERFFRVDTARSRESGGAGLGLSIGRSIATRHGGRLAIESELGSGTRVSLVLPALEPRTAAGY